MKIKLNDVLMGILIGAPSLSLGALPGPDLFTETDYYAEQPVVLSVSKLAQSQAWAPAAPLPANGLSNPFIKQDFLAIARDTTRLRLTN